MKVLTYVPSSEHHKGGNTAKALQYYKAALQYRNDDTTVQKAYLTLKKQLKNKWGATRTSKVEKLSSGWNRVGLIFHLYRTELWLSLEGH